MSDWAIGPVIASGASLALIAPSSDEYSRGPSTFDYDALHYPSPNPTGETVARAKRTARADARRRYRAVTGQEIDADFETSEDASEGASSARTARPIVGRSEATPPARVGIFDALRTSFHRPQYREDLAALPSLVTNKALWLPLLLIAATAVAVATIGRTNLLVNFATTYFLELPAIGAVFLAGFLAPRASWLLGIIVGLGSALGYTVLVYGAPATLYPPELFKALPGPADAFQLSVQAFIISPIMGSLFAAAAAWYRRFLRLSNPNRSRQAAPPRRGDGRTRASNSSQKATARR
jgi:hypothetical protein